MGYTYYNPLKVWLDPASIADVVSYMQKYLSENPIKDTEEINQIIADYIAAHPEIIGGVQSVNGETGVVVLTASDINTTGTTTIQAVLTSLASQISDITQTVTQNTNDISDLKSALHPYNHSTNYLNPDDILTDYQINANGVAESYEGRCASGWIEAQNGATVYFTGINENGAMLSLTGVSMLRLAWYNSNKEFINAATWVNSYTLNDSNIAYIRFCYTNAETIQKARRLALMFTQPTTVADIDKYYVAGYDVTDITARNNMRIVIPDAFVDAWGDSRIANGGSTTSITKYLANKLGWYTANHGYGGQGSGEIAITMGAIDCYVTLANNQILDGDNVVSAIAINHGNSVQNVMQNSDAATNGVPCSIGGINGFLWCYGGELKFTTASTLSNAVTVMPMTKVITPVALLHRFIIIWAGKNDFSNYSASGLYEYLADTVSAMAEHIPHDRFVILGETATSSNEYKFGGAARTVMDNYNNLMARRFPNNFIDIQNELVENGLNMAGITPTETDISDIQNGWLPSSLMSDTTHQNEICRNVIAQIIYSFMADKAWA